MGACGDVHCVHSCSLQRRVPCQHGTSRSQNSNPRLAMAVISFFFSFFLFSLSFFLFAWSILPFPCLLFPSPHGPWSCVTPCMSEIAQNHRSCMCWVHGARCNVHSAQCAVHSARERMEDCMVTIMITAHARGADILRQSIVNRSLD